MLPLLKKKLKKVISLNSINTLFKNGKKCKKKDSINKQKNKYLKDK